MAAMLRRPLRLQQDFEGVAALRMRERVERLMEMQLGAMRQKILLSRHRVDLQLRSLNALDPDKTLARGFAKVSKGEVLVTSVKQLQRDDDVVITLADGKADARIK